MQKRFAIGFVFGKNRFTNASLTTTGSAIARLLLGQQQVGHTRRPQRANFLCAVLAG